MIAPLLSPKLMERWLRFSDQQKPFIGAAKLNGMNAVNAESKGIFARRSKNKHTQKKRLGRLADLIQSAIR